MWEKFRNGNSGGCIFLSTRHRARVTTKAIQADVRLCHPGVGFTRQKGKILASCQFSLFDAALNSFCCNPCTESFKKKKIELR